MIALSECTHENFKKAGKHSNGAQRFKCKDCGKRFVEEKAKPLGDMRVDINKAMMVIGMLLEGMSIRACERLTSMNRDTIDRLILEVGDRCQTFMEYNITNVALNDIQIDEIWSFVGMKAKQAKKQDDATQGDSWTYIAVDRETKLVPCHFVGQRNQIDTDRFLSQLRKAVDCDRSFQVSTDGWAAYRYGVPFALGSNVNYGMLIKQYASSQEVTRYSPAQIIGAKKEAVFGAPEMDKVCTSHIESLNQKLRLNCKRFARLTQAHSKSLKHHVAMQAIYFSNYNFCRLHTSLDKQTPAMAAGLVDHPLQLVEMLGA
ncbi:hypothetical protein N9L06_07015 [Mariniblastus sp.]|nr:hypothetical protein [Mariniblastus sp.]